MESKKIKRMKEMVTDIYHSTDQVKLALHVRDASIKADEQQAQRIHDLQGIFQQLEVRMKQSDEQFRELENMVHKLGPSVDRAVSLLTECTRVLNEDQENYDQVLGTDTIEQSHEGKEGSRSSNAETENIPPPRKRSESDITSTVMQKHSPSSRFQSSESKHSEGKHTPDKTNNGMTNVKALRSNENQNYVDNIQTTTTDKKEDSAVKVIVQTGVKEPFTLQSNSESVHTEIRKEPIAISLNEMGFKRRKTEMSVDNRIRCMRKAEAKIGEKEGQVTRTKQDDHDKIKTPVQENTEHGPHEELTKSLFLQMKESGETAVTTLAGAAGFDASQTEIMRSSAQEIYEYVEEDPDMFQQIGRQGMSLDTLVQDNMANTAFIIEMGQLAEKEKEKGHVCALPRGPGPDTVLCLDASGSMQGIAFQDMISVAIQFVEGIQQVSAVLGVRENIAVATFGRKHSVLIHLTDQYEKVKEVLLSITPGGPSRMFAGIHMALAACEGNGRQVTMDGVILGARIILISDGKGTPDYWRLTEDTVDPTDAKANLAVVSNMVAAGHMVNMSGHTVYCVPVGDYTERALERVARISGGAIIKKHEIGRLIRLTQNQVVNTAGGLLVPEVDTNLAAAIESVQMCKDLADDVDREPYLRAIIGIDTSAGEPNKDKEDILRLAFKYIKQKKTSALVGEKGDAMVEVSAYMPCIGTRVRRGPDWTWKNQDRNGPGTVVGHDSDYMVWVEWDSDGSRNVYNHTPSRKDVRVVVEPRELEEWQDIAVGCEVKRGKDWTFGNQDGGEGSAGVVCRVAPTRVVHVRWPNKLIKDYRFGVDGCSEVQLIRPVKYQGSSTSGSILPPRRREGVIIDQQKKSAEEMSVDDMNRRNEAK